MKQNWREVLGSVSLEDTLIKLYNGIMNDGSIQYYTLGWSDVTNFIKNFLKGNITKTNDSFEDSILKEAINISEGKLKEVLEKFAAELNINLDTLRDKYKN
jgi:hypothetical protein